MVELNIKGDAEEDTREKLLFSYKKSTSHEQQSAKTTITTYIALLDRME